MSAYLFDETPLNESTISPFFAFYLSTFYELPVQIDYFQLSYFSFVYVYMNIDQKQSNSIIKR